MNKLIKICEKFNRGKDIYCEELEYVAYFDMHDFSDQLRKYVVDTFFSVMDLDCFEEWDDYDPQYPNNPYHIGFKDKDNGTIFVTGYTGVAGRFWRKDNDWCICLYR